MHVTSILLNILFREFPKMAAVLFEGSNKNMLPQQNRVVYGGVDSGFIEILLTTLLSLLHLTDAVGYVTM